MKDRQIDHQFEKRTMPLARTLLKLEKDGIRVDGARLEELRLRLVDRMLEWKKHVSDGIGSEVDLDSTKEISILMTEKLGLREGLGRKSLTQSLIEQFAPQQPIYAITSWRANTGRADAQTAQVLEELRSWQRSLPRRVSVLIVPDEELSAFAADTFPAGILLRDGKVQVNLPFWGNGEQLLVLKVLGGQGSAPRASR